MKRKQSIIRVGKGHQHSTIRVGKDKELCTGRNKTEHDKERIQIYGREKSLCNQIM